MRRSLVVMALWCCGCSVVRAAHVRDDWALEDQRRVKRLAMVVQPLPDQSQKAGELFARVARRYVNLKRDFLVKKEIVQLEAAPLETVCGGDDAIEGVLQLIFSVQHRGAGLEVSVLGTLKRCGDGRDVWTVDAGGSFPAKDPGLTEVAGVYVRELGPEVEAYVPAAFNLLRPALDTLPQPVLTEADRDEKLSLD